MSMKLKRRPADSFNFKDIKDITFDELLSVFKDRIVFLNSECWRWLGETHINNDSIYPRVKINGKYYPVHRLFYEKKYNIILDENDLHHKCDFTLCINPKHIEALKASIHKSNHFHLRLYYTFFHRIICEQHNTCHLFLLLGKYYHYLCVFRPTNANIHYLKRQFYL